MESLSLKHVITKFKTYNNHKKQDLSMIKHYI